MSSKSNLKFTIDRSRAAQIKTLEKETSYCESPNVDYSWVQGLLHSKKYLHFADPIGELAHYLQISRPELIAKIEVCCKGAGHLPLLNSSIYKHIKVNIQFLQVDKTSIDRQPIIDVLNSIQTGWCYRTNNGVYLALFLHLHK
jgi:hypothetical protein